MGIFPQGYGVAAAAKEIGQLRDTIKEAIEETVNHALEEKLGGRDGNVKEEQALAMRQLRKDNAAHKKEIEVSPEQSTRAKERARSSKQGKPAAGRVPHQEEENKDEMNARAEVQQQLEPRKEAGVQQAFQRE